MYTFSCLRCLYLEIKNVLPRSFLSYSSQDFSSAATAMMFDTFLQDARIERKGSHHIKFMVDLTLQTLKMGALAAC